MMAVKSTTSRIYGVILILLIGSITLIGSKKQVRFVSVVFRHGNRAPDERESELYPKDPHINNTFYPVGPGGLTNTGKQIMYNLGHKLRNIYNDFLGDLYIPADVEARSSDVPRTKTSLQLVLAGLYPPKGIQTWKKRINWQPIATEYVPKNVDNLFFAPYSCPKYFEELMCVNSLPEVKKIVEDFRPILKKLTIKTGKPMKHVVNMWNLYHGLMGEKSMHLKLPKWTKNFFPNGSLLKAANLVYQLFSWNDLLKRLNGGEVMPSHLGFLYRSDFKSKLAQAHIGYHMGFYVESHVGIFSMMLKRIIDDMKAVAENGTSTKARKINLFSGHQFNVAAMLSALRLFVPHVPQYSSAVIIELIRYKKIHYVKVIRYLGIPSVFKVETIPNCNTLCPLDKFITLMQPVTPLDVEKECKSDKISPSALAMMIKQFG